jgi:hypothetical protein
VDQFFTSVPIPTAFVQPESLGTLPLRLRLRQRLAPFPLLQTSPTHTCMERVPPRSLSSYGAAAVTRSLSGSDFAAPDHAPADQCLPESDRQSARRIHSSTDDPTDGRCGFTPLWFLCGRVGVTTRPVPLSPRIAPVAERSITGDSIADSEDARPMSHSLWLLRNQHLHGTDPNNTTTSYKHLHLLAHI